MNLRNRFKSIVLGVVIALGPTAALAVPVEVNIEQLAHVVFSDVQGATTGSFSQISPTATTYIINTDFKFLINDDPALGSATGLLNSLIGTANDGCLASDYAGFVSGQIALMGDSSCLYKTQVEAAAAAGAIAAILQIDVSGGASISSNFAFCALSETCTQTIPSLVITPALATTLDLQLLQKGQTVSEPAALAVFAFGLAGLGFMRRRRLIT